jgi:hypothetical protein
MVFLNFFLVLQTDNSISIGIGAFQSKILFCICLLKLGLNCSRAGFLSQWFRDDLQANPCLPYIQEIHWHSVQLSITNPVLNISVGDTDPHVFGPSGSGSIFFASLKSLRKGVGSGSGTITQRYGSRDPDPDPHQYVTDPQNC